jgi:hypothetical protein
LLAGGCDDDANWRGVSAVVLERQREREREREREKEERRERERDAVAATMLQQVSRDVSLEQVSSDVVSESFRRCGCSKYQLQ